MKKVLILIIALLAASQLIFGLFLLRKSKISADPLAYVGRQACISCHETEHNLWQGSHHNMAMQPANDSTVLGNFNNVPFNHFGQTSRLFKTPDGYYVNTEGPDGKMQDFKIKYTFGFKPLQQYLIEFPGGRMQCLGITWDDSLMQWYHLYPNQKIAPDDWLHWTRGAQNWNLMCAECHSTDLQKRYHPDSDNYSTTWFEIDVSCEACHGPASGHLKWAQADKLTRRLIDPVFNRRYGLQFRSKGVGNKMEVARCAPCHSHRGRVAEKFDLSGDYMDVYLPSVLEEGLYHPDGQIQGEVYVYGSFLQSKMYHNHVRCSDCHNPHSLKFKASGNNLCVQCHKKGDYDTDRHHYHTVGAPGSRCVECHMAGEVYMGIDFRRDHSFRIPRPDHSVKLGVPNACNKCHTDKTPEWAAAGVDSLWGPERPWHFAEIFAAARNADPEAQPGLLSIIGDSGKAAIIRATALSLLQYYPGDESDRVRLANLQDSVPLVRHTALKGLDHIPTRKKKVIVSPLLKDSIRAIRIEAVNVMADVPKGYFNAAELDTFNTAFKEFEHFLAITADFPSGQMNAGNLYLKMGDTVKAMSAFRQAIRIDSRFAPARVNLANLYNRQGRNAEAVAEFKEVIRQEPRFGHAYYSLGLLLAETGNLAEAARYLDTASAKMPDNPRIYYNLGLAMQRLGNVPEAEAALKKALALVPDAHDFLNAMVIFYMQQGRQDKARVYASRLKTLYPGNQQYERLYQMTNQ